MVFFNSLPLGRRRLFLRERHWGIDGSNLDVPLVGEVRILGNDTPKMGIKTNAKSFHSGDSNADVGGLILLTSWDRVNRNVDLIICSYLLPCEAKQDSTVLV